MSARQKWPTERTFYGKVEYKREAKGSYLVSTLYGLLLGRVHRDTATQWRAEGWTPETDGWEFGPFKARWECFEALLGVESTRRHSGPVGIELRDQYAARGKARHA